MKSFDAMRRDFLRTGGIGMKNVRQRLEQMYGEEGSMHTSTNARGNFEVADGKLDDGQRRTLLRLATAAARAGDDATLTTLRQSAGPRMESGPLADMFRLLTADQVHNVGDLKRSGQEAALARELAANDWQLRELITADGGAGAGAAADRNVVLAIDWPRSAVQTRLV